VRLALSPDCAGELRAAFQTKFSLPTAAMVAIEADASPQLSEAGRVLAEAGVPSATLADRVLVREACVCISTRAALLSAVGVASLLELTGHEVYITTRYAYMHTYLHTYIHSRYK